MISVSDISIIHVFFLLFLQVKRTNVYDWGLFAHYEAIWCALLNRARLQWVDSSTRPTASLTAATTDWTTRLWLCWVDQPAKSLAAPIRSTRHLDNKEGKLRKKANRRRGCTCLLHLQGASPLLTFSHTHRGKEEGVGRQLWRQSCSGPCQTEGGGRARERLLVDLVVP